MVSTFWLVYFCCFSTHGPSAQPFVKVGGTCPSVPYGFGAGAQTYPKITFTTYCSAIKIAARNLTEMTSLHYRVGQ